MLKFVKECAPFQVRNPGFLFPSDLEVSIECATSQVRSPGFLFVSYLEVNICFLPGFDSLVFRVHEDDSTVNIRLMFTPNYLVQH